MTTPVILDSKENMDQLHVQELARTWITYTSLPDAKRKASSLRSACEELDELVRSKPEEAWQVILAIREQNVSELLLANLAAGPLENLLVRHGEQFIDRCELLARQDKEFLYLLTGVWGSNGMSKDLWNRFCVITERSERRL
ncbi:MAG TPA: hypothetical protein VNE82_23680 [Candidatus Binataceae bacterium]|nr:hypothetical protein [Candidatus Binataceae bacterium]